MFTPGDYQYRLDQQRRDYLLRQSQRQQFVRMAVARTSKPVRAAGVLLVQL